MTAIEKNTFFNDLSVKLQFTNMNRSRFYTYPGSGIFSKREDPVPIPTADLSSTEDIFDSYNIDVDSVETFGIEKVTPLPPPETMDLKVNEKQQTDSEVGNYQKSTNKIKEGDCASSIATDSDSDEASLVIDTDNDGSPRKKRTTESRKVNSPRKKLSTDANALEEPKSTDSGSEKNTKITEDTFKSPVSIKPAVSADANLLNVILQDQEKMMQSNRKLPAKNTRQSTVEPENPQDYVPPKMNQNLTYRTWDLQANEKSIRLLVRSSVDTAVVSPYNFLASREIKLLSIGYI